MMSMMTNVLVLNASIATYKVNDKNVNKDEYEKVIEDIKKKYSRSIRDMLLGYSEFLDEMNEWRKLLNW